MIRKLLAGLLSILALAAAPSLRAEVFYGIDANGIWSADVVNGGPGTQVLAQQRAKFEGHVVAAAGR